MTPARKIFWHNFRTHRAHVRGMPKARRAEQADFVRLGIFAPVVMIVRAIEANPALFSGEAGGAAREAET